MFIAYSIHDDDDDDGGIYKPLICIVFIRSLQRIGNAHASGSLR